MDDDDAQDVMKGEKQMTDGGGIVVIGDRSKQLKVGVTGSRTHR